VAVVSAEFDPLPRTLHDGSLSIEIGPRLSFAAVALAAATALTWSTRHGLGISTDSVAYLTAANRLLADDSAGFAPVIKRFPPGYPLMLAGASLLAGDPRSAARGAAVALFAINVLLVGAIACRIAGTRRAGLAAAAFAAVASPVVEPHAWVWSEPMFVAATLGLALALDLDPDANRRVSWVCAAGLAGVAALTRYVGVAVMGATAASLAVRPRPARAAVGRAYGIGLAVVLPLGWWMSRTASATGSPTGRSVLFHPPGRREATEAVGTVAGWFTPRGWPLGWHEAALAALVVASIAGWGIVRREPALSSPPSSRLLAIVLALAGAHLAVVLVSRAFFDADVPLDDRILLPEFLALVFLAAHGFAALGRRQGRARLVRGAALAAAIALAVLHGVRTSIFLRNVRAEGLGYASSRWRESETIAWLRRNPPSGPVFTNYPDALAFQTGQAALWLPWKSDPNAALETSDYGRELARLDEPLRREGGIIVWFREPRRLLPDRAELESALGVRPIAELSDGVVLAAAP
jgi:hypothetical protein